MWRHLQNAIVPFQRSGASDRREALRKRFLEETRLFLSTSLDESLDRSIADLRRHRR